MRDAAAPSLYPRTQAEAKNFKSIVSTDDGLRELVPQEDGGWTAEPVTAAIYTQDPRPLHHMKMPMADADLNQVVKLPGEHPGEVRHFLLTTPTGMPSGWPRQTVSLSPVLNESDPYGHNGKIFYGSTNFTDHSFVSNGETPIKFDAPSLSAFMQAWSSSLTST